MKNNLPNTQATDYGELSDVFALLSDAVAGKRVIMLGEPEHGDGAAFAIRAKLVEYLHLQHGFNVLAFESDFYAMHYAWEAAESASDALALAQYVYLFWRDDKSMQQLWHFVAQRFDSSRPLIIAGVDVRHRSTFSPSVVTTLEKFLCTVDKELVKNLLKGMIFSNSSNY